ncbi:MAG: SH3 domain-containing protein [Coleofasciculaceae cyanobacterium SM2_1_6]|nr:SH3 domain-containing protein [Coleofasciculaceae cyanobacterium SM2_1_6]
MRKHLSFLPVLLLSIALPSGLIIASENPTHAQTFAHNPTATKQRIPENVLRACRAAISTMVGQNAQLTANTLGIYTISSTEESLRGRGNVTVADGSVQPFEFNCKLRTRTDVVTGTDYRFLNAPTTAVASANNSSRNNASTGRTAIVETPERTCLNLRTGPGTNNQAMSCAAYGSSVTLNGNNSGEWAQLTSGLWAYRPYLR